ncbi:hypothetical protein BD779DRAFT_1678141 [Infundibulicybe gibba]|nr:hypothetical protein BD779DRAFT_1678141 [Infundibulicybe gibba]
MDTTPTRLVSRSTPVPNSTNSFDIRGPAFSRFLTYIFNITPTPSPIADVAFKIHMALLLFIPLLYSSRIQGVLDEANHGIRLETQFLTTWATLRVLSCLILATIFSIFQISGLRGNETMIVAALFSFAAVVYDSALMIYVNGWGGGSGASMWIREIHEPFTIGFLWDTSILLALPAIWTTWGAILFLIAMMMAWISGEGVPPILGSYRYSP